MCEMIPWKVKLEKLQLSLLLSHNSIAYRRSGYLVKGSLTILNLYLSRFCISVRNAFLENIWLNSEIRLNQTIFFFYT